MAGIRLILLIGVLTRCSVLLTLVASPGTLTRMRLLAPLHIETPSASRRWAHIDAIVVELFLGFYPRS